MKKLKYLLFILPFLFISNVKAGSISEVRLFGHRLDDKWLVGANSSTTSTADYFLFNDSSVPNYLYADVCTTGNPPTVWVTGFGGNTRLTPDTKVYKVNKPCSVAGYSANIYRFTFYVTSFDDAGNGNLGLQFNTQLFNNTDYNTYFRLFSITYSDSLSYSDIDLTNQENIIEQNNQIISGQNDIKDSVNKVDDTLKDNNIQEAQDSAGGFFNDFTTDTHGLTSIITAPLSLIESITSSTCSPLVIPLPYVDKDLTLPCMGEIYSNYFGSFLSIYQVITFGIVAYWVLVRIFNLVKDFKNPDHDEIEVLDL